MSAGLPGAGLGAVLYTVLILLMPLCQMIGMRHGAIGWKGVGRNCLLLFGMILLAWLESEIAVWFGFISASKLVRLLPLLLLFVIFVLLEVLGWIARRQRSRPIKPV